MLVDGLRGGGFDAGLDLDTGGPQRCGTAGRNRVGIVDADDDPGNAGGDERLGAGSGTTDMRAGFEGDDQRGAAPAALPGDGQGVDLGVWAAGTFVPALADDSHAITAEDDAADDWVRSWSARDRGAASDAARRIA